MGKLKSVHHIVLKVKDPKKSAEFYQKVCGLKIFTSEDEAYGLTGGQLDSLWLVKPDNGEKAIPFSRRGNIGLDHWGWAVSSEEDLKDIEKSLKEQGIKMEDGGITDDGYGGKAIFTQDPDGMTIEFHLAGKA